MAKPEFIARQSAHPTGLFGHLVARVMAFDTAGANRRLLQRLDPKPGEAILELGCGHGRTLRQVSAKNAPGLAAGVDPSGVMLRVARGHLRRGLASGQVRVAEGDAAHIPHADESFDKAFTVHTLYFWVDLRAGFQELHRVLRPGGELILGFHDGADPALHEELPDSVYTLHTAEEVAAALEAEGFHDITSAIDEKTGLTFAHARR
ncbi:MAG: methyltransferase domain-containing protein [Deltaproteobacteria bacterium]|nr:methyltransferase domain-containing protein [Deltaproteobacteria bacterium]MBW2446159.1 methyltransferase domain-containing protein [Deltaproteobacteria bacterium]